MQRRATVCRNPPTHLTQPNKERIVQPEEFDLVILGGGTGSTVAAWTFAGEGRRVAVVDRKYIGGSCPNIACLPSKNIIHTAKVASYLRRSREFGVALNGFTIQMPGVRERKRRMVRGLNETYLENYRQTGAEFILATGRFIAPRTVEATLSDGTIRQLRGKNVIVSTGTRATIDSTPGLADAQPLTHIEALELDTVPEHLLVIGGGYVGVELAQAMRRFGSKVTVIQHGTQLLNDADPDIAEAVLQLMTDEGIQVLLNADVQKVTGLSGQSLQLQIGGKTIQATDILVATGRTPNTDSLSAEKAGVQLDSHGFVRVNDFLQTTAPDVWAMGDCAGSPFFTHVGYDDFRIVRDNLAGKPHSKKGRLIPSCLFLDPELAQIGLTESAAKAQNVRYRLAKIPANHVLRTHTTSETRGFLKALVGTDDRILGFTAFCSEASELLAAVQAAMLAGSSYTMLRDGIFAHPTMAEGVTVLFASVPDTPQN